MSKVSKRNIVAASVFSALALGSSQVVAADKLSNLQKEQGKINTASAHSQKKINAVYEQTQDLFADYRQTVDETENLKVYNDHVARLVADQQRSIDSLQSQIDSIVETKRGVIPLMYKMIDALDKFIDLDVPINLDERKARVKHLRELMGQSDVSVSEQFRQVLEAYQIENEYGTMIRAYRGELDSNGKKVAVDFFNLGRTAMLALSLDQKSAWAWDKEKRGWDKLGDEYVGSVTTAVKMAKKLVPYDLIKLPIEAAE